MRGNTKVAITTLLILCAGIGVGWFLSQAIPTAAAQADKGGSHGIRYSVMETQGHNLIVTDNQTNTLYFYTVDKDKDVGAELRLRGTVDLTQVGKPEIKPKTYKH